MAYRSQCIIEQHNYKHYNVANKLCKLKVRIAIVNKDQLIVKRGTGT